MPYDNELDKIFDEENDEPVYLYDENDNKVAFDQVAVIPLNDDVFVILKPIEPMDDVGEDEALVFEICEDDEGEEFIQLVVDEDVVDEVFAEYYKLLEEDED